MTSHRTTPPRDTLPGPGRSGVDWRTLLVRSFLAVLPGQLVGTFLGTVVIGAVATMDMWPGWTYLINVFAGLAAGLALGLALRPSRGQRPLYLAVSAVFGVVVLALLLVLARQRMPIPYDVVWSQVMLGVLLTVGVQTLLAWVLWRMRDRQVG